MIRLRAALGLPIVIVGAIFTGIGDALVSMGYAVSGEKREY